jgi:tetrahydromethanopterin S-methyltransferase subunit G
VTDEPLRRRSSDRAISEIDKRLGFLERDMDAVTKTQLPDIDRKLDVISVAMADPFNPTSQAGRQFERTRVQVEALQTWQSEMIGAAKLARLIQILLGIVVALLALMEVAR